MGLYSVSRERRTDFYPADHSNHCALTAKVRLQVDHVYGSAFACRHMHVTWPDGHIPGAYPYKYTHAHTHIGMCTAPHPVSSDSNPQISHCLTPGFLSL